MQGTVALFKSQENFGFIETDEMDDDVFFHISEVAGDSVNEGDTVEFDQEDGDKGPKATNVSVVEGDVDVSDDSESDFDDDTQQDF